MPFEAAHKKLADYMDDRSRDPGTHRAARGWYADKYTSIAEMNSVWGSAAENAEWRTAYANNASGRQPLGALGASRRKVHWLAVCRRDHHAQFLADGLKPIRALDLRVRYSMLRNRFSRNVLKRLKDIITALAGK